MPRHARIALVQRLWVNFFENTLDDPHICSKGRSRDSLEIAAFRGLARSDSLRWSVYFCVRLERNTELFALCMLFGVFPNVLRWTVFIFKV